MIDVTKEYLIPYSILRNVRSITGNECLVLLLLNGYGSMKIKKLKELIYSDTTLFAKIFDIFIVLSQPVTPALYWDINFA